MKWGKVEAISQMCIKYECLVLALCEMLDCHLFKKAKQLC